MKLLPIPEIKPWEVLVALSVSGVCGTDISLAAGHLGPFSDILGHEGVGHVAAIGSGVQPEIVKIGDRVGVAWVRDVCGKCQPCRVPGGETRCIEQWNSGRNQDGTFQQYCVVPARYILALPARLTISDELVAPILCGGVTAYKALKVCNAKPGDWVAILGAGGLGSLGVQYAKAMGFRVIAIDVGRERESLCLKLGAEAYLDAVDELQAGVRKVTGDTYAKAAIVTAGSGRAYKTAFDIVSAFGTVVCVGIPPPDQRMDLSPLQFIDKDITLIGVLVGTRTDTLEALDFVERGVVVPSIHQINLDDLPETMKNFHQVLAPDLCAL